MNKLEDNLEKLVGAICKELPNITDGKTIYRISSALKFYTDKILQDNIDKEAVLETNQNSLYSLIEDSVTDLYECNRTWDAWQAGTMTEDDFELVGLDHNILDLVAQLRDL